jgi:hypothetical protein
MRTHQFAPLNLHWPSLGGWLRDQGFQESPLLVSQIGGIRSPAHGRSHTSLAPFATSAVLDIISFLFFIGETMAILHYLRLIQIDVLSTG